MTRSYIPISMRRGYEAIANNTTFMLILETADKAYPDNYIMQVWDLLREGEESGFGDGLAEFIVRELAETFDEDAEYVDQLHEAARVMEMAGRELRAVESSLTLLATEAKAKAVQQA
jgi:hypothetical protein